MASISAVEKLSGDIWVKVKTVTELKRGEVIRFINGKGLLVDEEGCTVFKVADNFSTDNNIHLDRLAIEPYTIS